MRLYTASEFAERYHLHEDTVYRLGREGKLKTEKVGRSVRFYDPTEEREVQSEERCEEHY